MSAYFRVVAIDFDGTLSEGGRPGSDVLDALAQTRAGGRRVVLVTGRVVDDLRGVFGDFEDWFDAVVAENGAVLHAGGVSRALAPPVPLELDARLVERGVSFRRGQVLLDCDGRHELAVLDELRRLGSDCQLVRNRAALMLLPAGVSKGSGLFEALGELGVSRHSAIGIGDAENDLSLLAQCEVGVAVGNAVEGLKQHADVVLREPDGEGVARLLRGPLLTGDLAVEPSRWQVEIGRGEDGAPVTLPGSQVNVLVAGGSGAGKSYVAGLLAERLVALGYSLCVIDPEGDHAPLGRLRGVVSVGGRGALPSPDTVPRLLQHRLGSLVVDLSQMSVGERGPYVAKLLAQLEEQRARVGVPHWIFIDEAHVPLHPGAEACRIFAPAQKGYCLVTWRPDDLCEQALECFDIAIAVAGEKGLDDETRAQLDRLAALPEPGLGGMLGRVGFGQALVVRLGARAEARRVDLGPRWVRHVRHWHKYAEERVPDAQRFHFRGARGLTGATAGNAEELHRELTRCGDDVVEQHARGGDFSRWVEDVLKDRPLALSLRGVERRVDEGVPADVLCRDLLAAIESRYLE